MFIFTSVLKRSFYENTHNHLLTILQLHPPFSWLPLCSRPPGPSSLLRFCLVPKSLAMSCPWRHAPPPQWYTTYALTSCSGEQWWERVGRPPRGWRGRLLQNEYIWPQCFVWITCLNKRGLGTFLLFVVRFILSLPIFVSKGILYGSWIVQIFTLKSSSSFLQTSNKPLTVFLVSRNFPRIQRQISFLHG